MFCPKCGNLLLLKGYESGRSELYCVKGDMGLSQIMQQKFEEHYGHMPLLNLLILHLTNNFMEEYIGFALAMAKGLTLNLSAQSAESI